MSSTNTSNKSPEEIEREVEQVRAEVRTTLGDIRESLSPGQMLDQALDYVRHSGGADFSKNLGRSVRDNPLPVALIGAGIGWLMVSDRTGSGHSGRGWMSGRPHLRYTADELYTDPDTHHVHVDGDEKSGLRSRAGGAMSGASHRMGDAANTARDRAGSMASSAREGAGSVASSAREGVDSVREGTRRMAHDARDRMSGVAETASEYASYAGESVRHAAEGVRHAGERVRDYGYGAQRSAARMAEEQPMVLGALGFALGAVLGSLLPTSRTEQRLFGSTSDRVKEQARSMAREGMSEASAKAGEAVHAVGEGVKSTLEPSKRKEGNGGSGTKSTETTSGATTSHH